LGEDTDKAVTNWDFEPLSLSDSDKRFRETIKRLELLVINAFSLKSADIKQKEKICSKKKD
jgi:hypothetical protein